MTKNPHLRNRQGFKLIIDYDTNKIGIFQAAPKKKHNSIVIQYKEQCIKCPWLLNLRRVSGSMAN
jgi:hypothetical protein